MEHFIVSARKYRPAVFKDVVGQQAITNTLENAIENNHLAQALLFTGPRGVGKTTCARILAKKINQDGTEKEDEDFAFNIFELDAASNNSVDDIRNLIDQVRIPPQVGKYKVYIIDEVHMLSSAAFNAFLKTLEEPPKHAIFILATTEKHKIIPTILSRCQIFDFRRIGVRDIKNHLADVAKAENIDAEDDALHIIAQKADGALRDALSIFDRVVSFSGKNLTREAVTENLNVLDYTWYFQITDLLLENNIPQVLVTYNDILSKGFDGHHFIMGLASHFRDLLVCKNQVTIELLEVGEQVKTMYFEQSQKTDTQFLIDGIDIANTCDLKYKNSQNQRLLVELCLLQLASLTFQGEKKKLDPRVDGDLMNNSTNRFVIPPSHFKSEKFTSEKITSAGNVVPQSPKKIETEIEMEIEESKASEPSEELGTENTQPKTPVHRSFSSVGGENQEQTTDNRESQKVIERPQILAERNAKKVSALSLKSIQKKQEIKQEMVANQPDAENLPVNNFSEEEMQAAWTEYTANVESEGKFNLLSHLTMGVPKLDGSIIHLEFPNHTIKTEVERAKYELLSFLREKLQNYEIDLDIIVNETITKRYAYTTREKFEKMKEMNPLIEKLRQEFDLDI
ncbi:DNA polymerase III subunit gamma/tau [Aequorivita lipolytica]|uniref:DNA polymerase III subunit gamma/tau n=1 Tax=Aequorivita lipolytica TaxID=153267 RepID=A0A5C6YQ71_9FLAO|nr:DNA polymerase III subunit gamma/tau [Aequorivita lipolytica]TXD69176.1 DNA polymerase III subunit gamma/tau [Aequorivita lipolytica]SRX51241.1 DNA polymerase III subunit tau [Aequorivita lipolytica]